MILCKAEKDFWQLSTKGLTVILKIREKQANE